MGPARSQWLPSSSVDGLYSFVTCRDGGQDHGREGEGGEGRTQEELVEGRRG